MRRAECGGGIAGEGPVLNINWSMSTRFEIGAGKQRFQRKNIVHLLLIHYFLSMSSWHITH